MKTPTLIVAVSLALLGVAAAGTAHPLDILGVAYVDPNPEHDVEGVLNGEVPEEPPEYSVWVETNDCAGLQKNAAQLARDGCATSDTDTQVA